MKSKEMKHRPLAIRCGSRLSMPISSALGAPVLSGRDFTPSDLASEREVAIVNTSFVERVLRGRDPVGRRIRRATLEASRRQVRGLKSWAWCPTWGSSAPKASACIGLYLPATPPCMWPFT